MGIAGRRLVPSSEVIKVIELLNKAFADEWLAYYQCWIGSKIVKGPMKETIISKLLQHANDELKHANLLSNRIIQLGGMPLLSPKEWFDNCNTGYATPIDPYILEILRQNLESERESIGVYKKIMEITKDKDIITYDLILQIIKEEILHEEDLQALEEDFEIMLSR